jgi:hypothetical protein
VVSQRLKWLTGDEAHAVGLLSGVTTFNFHLHLPHHALTTEDTKSIYVLARQPFDLSRQHSFTISNARIS